MKRIRQQQGVALLVVLILLVMMSALAAKISQQFCRNLQKTHYQVSQQQLRWAMQAQEKVVKDRLQTDTSGESKPLALDGDWHQPLETQGEDYTVVSQVEDAQDCFNVNNLLTADIAPQDDAVRLLDSRPESGWENMEAFSKALEQAFPQLKDDLPQVVDQFSINSRYFRVNYTGNTDELTLRVVSQLQVNNEAGEIVTWQRRYRMIE